jgi:glycosyltransferase involved in cell wall biosynthesis
MNNNLKRSNRRTVFILASLGSSLVNFRGPLISALVARGHQLHAAAPELTEDTATAEWLLGKGVTCHDVPISRAGLNPFADLRALLALTLLMRRVSPDAFIGYTIKPVIWGTLAAWMAGVPQKFALITGLGYAFTGKVQGKRALIQRAVRWLYAQALRRASLVFFQNPDDEAEFMRLNLIPAGLPTHVVTGSGVDTNAFLSAPIPTGPTKFLLIARLLGDKGIREYAAAAEKLSALNPEVEFHLVGGHDLNPDAIRPDEIRAWQEAGHIVWHGELEDVRPAITAAHVYVLPSYREGTPRTVLEAMAMGRPIITTDAPGCRETVIDGENGFLVPVRDVQALAQAMQRFLDEPTLVLSMGQRSREIAEDKYDVHKVNAVMLKAMGL